MMKEEPELADTYRSKAVAEQNSVDIAWNELLSAKYEALRSAIFGDIHDVKLFRQLLVNSVIATDIFDRELGALRANRWKAAFQKDRNGQKRLSQKDLDRRTTIVIEHLVSPFLRQMQSICSSLNVLQIQASDVAHTMQHFTVYLKWNRRLFQEMYSAFATGRSAKDPSENWYQGELSFFDNYVIPLALKLEECGVFGVSSKEFLSYATQNRQEWERRGQDIAAGMLAEAKSHHAARFCSEALC